MATRSPQNYRSAVAREKISWLAMRAALLSASRTDPPSAARSRSRA